MTEINYTSFAVNDQNVTPVIDKTPVLNVSELARVRDVTKIAESIEKVHRVLERVTASGNKGAIHTWNIVMARLRMQWMDAMIEVSTNGNYVID